jgi:hypothetical protein
MNYPRKMTVTQAYPFRKTTPIPTDRYDRERMFARWPGLAMNAVCRR